MLSHPATRYRAFPPVALPDRQWPSRTITRPPVWMSTDLRDGNQSLFEPMNGERKMRLFKTLCAVGFKEMEVGFPAASQTEFDFVRTLIQGGHVPPDVTIEVLTQAREDLIRTTFASLRGARRAIIHVYNATAPVFRNVVFGMGKPEVLQLAVSAVRLVRQLTASAPETEWVLQYSPELFTSTELEFARDVCDAVTAEWGATPHNKVILNLPATVEVATPNVYADQIEWMHHHLARRDSVVLSLHPHNDRGTAVAAAELGIMAGADRVEGCLFGNGERTGNVDIVTLALNLYTQGVAPGLDFSDINAIARTVEHCTQLPIHPRHPYVGDLVFTAFSGSHQDAIRKGFAAQQGQALWAVPYLPIDPQDLGRSYGSVIRVNSQSGKGGVAWLMETEFGIVMPRRLQVEFSATVQGWTDAHGGEMTAEQLWGLFAATWLNPAAAAIRYVGHSLVELPARGDGCGQSIRLEIDHAGKRMTLQGHGNSPIEAAMHALQSMGLYLTVRSYEERAVNHVGGVGAGGTTSAAARVCVFMELASTGKAVERFGVGLDGSAVTATLRALLSGVHRLGLKPGVLAPPEGEKVRLS